MGHQLAAETPCDADVIVPVPDSGVPAALGFSEASGIPFQMGIIRNHYVGRTFIQPTQTGRQSAISKKHSPNKAVLGGAWSAWVNESLILTKTSTKNPMMTKSLMIAGAPTSPIPITNAMGTVSKLVSPEVVPTMRPYSSDATKPVRNQDTCSQ